MCLKSRVSASDLILGARVGDLRTGQVVLNLECSKAMTQLNLYDRLVIHVQRQLDKQKLIKAPKAGSRGWVLVLTRMLQRS